MSFFKVSVVALSLGMMNFPSLAQDIRVDFRDVDINVFLDAVSKTTNIPIIYTPPLKGKVTLKSESLSQEEYLSTMRGVLRANGYSVLPIGDMLKVVDEKDNAGIHDEGGGDNDSARVVTRTLTLKTLPVAEIISQLTTLSGGKSKVSISGLGSANVLLLSGYTDDVERLKNLATALDNQQGRSTDMVPLLNANASETAKMISMLIANGDFANGSLKAGAVADSRTNSLMLSGNASDRKRLKAIIARLDREQDNVSSEGVVYLKYTSSDTIEKVLDKLIKAKDPRFTDVSVVSAADINAVIISASRHKKREVIDLVHQLDIRRAQVHVEAMIVEIANGDGINFGVQWSDNNGSLMQFSNGSQLPIGVLQGAMQQGESTKGSTVISDNGSTTINPDSKGDLTTLMSLLNGYNGAAASIVRGNWTALVQAMKSSSQVNILSTPSLTTQDNQSASFMVGQNVPILTGSTASSDNKTPFQTVDRRDVGTSLTILPQINEGDAVQLKIAAEVSKVEGNTGVDVTFAERKLETTVLVNDGSMLILGGLIDSQEDESTYKVPILGDIPLIGRLFRSDAKNTQKRNLMIFIRPTILRDGLIADSVTRKKYSYIEAQKLLKESGQGNISPYYDPQPSEIKAFLHAMKVGD